MAERRSLCHKYYVPYVKGFCFSRLCPVETVRVHYELSLSSPGSGGVCGDLYVRGQPCCLLPG